MATSKNNDMYSYLDQLSTQELEDLLQEDMEAADGGDLDMVMYIMEVIEKREGGISEADKKAAAQALEEFYNSYAIPEGDGLQIYPCDTPDCNVLDPDPIDFTHKTRHSRFSIRKALLLAAALICLSSLIACTALGFERVFQMVGKWTAEVFTFENQYTGDLPEENNSPDNLPPEDARYATIEEALDAYGITEQIVPVFPEDYEIVAVNVSSPEHSDYINFSTLYRENDRYIVFQVIYFTQAHAFDFEKDDTVVTEYQQGGLTYYFYQNNASNCVTCFNNNLECLIATDASNDILFSMITSLQ